jgi:zinc protease
MTNRPHRGIVGLVVILAGWASSAGFVRADGPPANGTRKPEIPILTVEQYTLGNGLKVILHEDHKTPLVSVNVSYNVGSKDDPPGRTGFAHLFEHMMFKGSLHNDQEFSNLIHEFAVETNGSTHRDRTIFYEDITTNALERALWLEADRMGYLLPMLTPDKLDIVRKVVKNERRSTYDNVAYGLVEEVLSAELYPPGHPYRHLTIGSLADLSAARISELRKFFERHYVPNNAVLCVAGDFQSDRVKDWIKEYFGPLRRGGENTKPSPSVPPLGEPKRVTMTDRVSHALARLIWPTVPAGHPDEAALDIVASVLGDLANESRLFRRLVFEEPLAAQVGASHPTYLLSGEFHVDLYAQSGQKLSNLVRIADQEIERLKNEGPSDVELRRAKNQRELSLILSLESARGQADVLSTYAAHVGDPLGYRRVIEDVFAVTRADVVRVARQYLGARRIEFHVLPGAKAVIPDDVEINHVEREPEPLPAGDPFADANEDVAVPAIGPMPHFSAPGFVRRRLSNGLGLRIVERHQAPLVSLTLTVRSGETSTPPGKEGLCSITAALLDEGTKSRSGLDIAGSLSEIGGTITTSGELESMGVSLTTLTPYLERGLDIYTDVILNPTFADPDLQRLKLERFATLESAVSNAESIASDILPRLLYPPEHPYSRPSLGTPKSLQSITRDDVVEFYRKTFVPGNAELVVVGDVTVEKIVSALESRLGSWRPGMLPSRPRVNTPEPVPKRSLYLIDLPGATQSVVTVGRLGPSGDSDLYNVLSMIVTLCAGRINTNIRHEKGFTYAFESDMHFRKGPGPMSWDGAVQTSATRESLVELIKEIADVTGPRAATNDEIAQMETSKATSLFARFETTSGIAYQVSYLVAYNLGDDYYATRLGGKYRVTKDELVRVAKQYLKPELMTILVVGDRSKIDGPLRSIPFVKSILLLDKEGNPLPEPAAPKSVAK